MQDFAAVVVAVDRAAGMMEGTADVVKTLKDDAEGPGANGEKVTAVENEAGMCIGV